MSLQRSLITIVLLALLVPAVLVGWWQTVTSYRTVMTSFETEHQRTLDALLLSLGVSVWAMDEQGAQVVLGGMFTDQRVVRITVLDDIDSVFAEVNAPARNRGRSVMLSAPLLHYRDEVARVEVVMDASPDLDLLVGTQLVYTFQVIAQLILSISALLWQLRRRFMRPLLLLEEQASKLSRKQLDEAFVWNREDELGHLGNSLERTRLDLKEAFGHLEARVAERTRELEAFSYSVSHDLRAPLRGIRSYADLLEEDFGGPLPAQAQHDLNRIHHGVKKMGQLIEDLLGLSKVARVDLTPTTFNLLDVIKGIWNDLEEKDPGRRIQLLTEGDFKVSGDKALLEIALRNLLDNAWKYSSKTPKAVVSVRAQTREGCRWFVVSDNGAGFDSARADDLFEPFQRLHGESEFPGNGIGLAIVKRVIDRHGGQVKAVALAAGGAEFSFCLKA